MRTRQVVSQLSMQMSTTELADSRVADYPLPNDEVCFAFSKPENVMHCIIYYMLNQITSNRVNWTV